MVYSSFIALIYANYNHFLSVAAGQETRQRLPLRDRHGFKNKKNTHEGLNKVLQKLVRSHFTKVKINPTPYHP
jgi:hypothetical protein